MPTRSDPITALLLGLSILILAGCAGTDAISRAEHPGSSSEAEDLRLGDSALNAGSIQMAASLYEKILQSHPDSLDATLGLGDVAYRSGDMERARLIYLQAEHLAPDRIEPKIGLARVEIRKRHLDEAISIYRKALAIQPDNQTAAAGLGTALDLQGNHGAAQAVYRQALLVHPEAQSVRIDLGLSLVLAKQVRDGADVLLDVANLPDAPAEARQDLALAFGVIGNTEAAKKILSRDLPPADVNDNLRFYAAVRQAYAENPASPPTLTTTPTPTATTESASHVHAAASP